MVQEETLNSNNGFTNICGDTIGRYAVIGAGAVVTKVVPDYALMLGNPAQIAGWACECGHQFRFHERLAKIGSHHKAPAVAFSYRYPKQSH